jgi:hypothetical protein
VIDSGNGLHVYWILKEQVETETWKPYAEKFKDLCHKQGLVIDPAVPADAARVLRVPFTKNYGKDGTVKDVLLINDEIYTYDFDEIVSHFGEVIISEDMPLILRMLRRVLQTKKNNHLDLTNMSMNLKKSQLNHSTESDVNKLSGSSKTPLVVRSHCGGLDYLSPSGVLMALQPYISYQKTTQTTTLETRSEKQRKPYLPIGRTDAANSKDSIQKDVKVVPLKTRSSLRLPWVRNYELPSRGLMIPQTQPNQKKYK